MSADFKRWIGLDSIAKPLHWTSMDHETSEVQVLNHALYYNSGVHKGTTYPIHSIKYERTFNKVEAVVVCLKGKTKKGNDSFKTFRFSEYQGGMIELIEYTGPPITIKKDIKYYDMFGVEYKVDDWFFHSTGLVKVVSIDNHGIRIMSLHDKLCRLMRTDFTLCAIVNDDLVKRANEHIVAKLLEV